jgi:hypothetical protein
MKTDVEVKDKNTGKSCILEKRSFIFVAYKATSRILSSNSKLLAVGDWILFAQVTFRV